MKKGIIVSCGIVASLILSGCGDSQNSSSLDKTTKSQTGKTAQPIKVQNRELQTKVKIQKPTSSPLKTTSSSDLKVLTPSQISRRSNPDYNCNTSGIITASTLTKWIDNWKENRPKGVDGRLIILQAGVTRFDDNKTFLPHNDKDVLTYAIPGVGSCDPSYTRYDGMS